MFSLIQSSYSGPASFPVKQSTNNGNIKGVPMAMPAQFYPSANSSLFAAGRQSYLREAWRETTPANIDNYTKKLKWNNTSASDVIHRRRINAIGKSSIQSAATTAELSFRSQDNTSRNEALRRCRSGGCVAPKKKGANTAFKSGGSSNIVSSGNRQIFV